MAGMFECGACVEGGGGRGRVCVGGVRRGRRGEREEREEREKEVERVERKREREEEKEWKESRFVLSLIWLFSSELDKPKVG